MQPPWWLVSQLHCNTAIKHGENLYLPRCHLVDSDFPCPSPAVRRALHRPVVHTASQTSLSTAEEERHPTPSHQLDSLLCQVTCCECMHRAIDDTAGPPPMHRCMYRCKHQGTTRAATEPTSSRVQKPCQYEKLPHKNRHKHKHKHKHKPSPASWPVRPPPAYPLLAPRPSDYCIPQATCRPQQPAATVTVRRRSQV